MIRSRRLEATKLSITDPPKLIRLFIFPITFVLRVTPHFSFVELTKHFGPDIALCWLFMCFAFASECEITPSYPIHNTYSMTLRIYDLFVHSWLLGFSRPGGFSQTNG